ncbi:MAG: phosphoribosylformylglycinamidine cyclo-ligase [Candidatus Saganbacteria bacterium]|nr:phosphoribosylformylglycinamidine cyclo-ligase [Candidatus Saganbacteria bacterium]
MDYKKAGVDIDAGTLAVKKIKKMVKSDTSLFGGCYTLDSGKVLVSATDGVGTKLKLAFMLNKHDTVGIDLVAMNVDDIVCQGARPLFFLDYIGCNKVFPDVIEKIVKGIVKGCRQAGCALIGGEIAELGDLYKKGEYDLAGFAVGEVDRKKIIDGKKIKPGDLILGLKSSGLHSNGYSLARKVLPKKYAKGLLIPTRIYAKSILKLLDKVAVNGIAHITGGGIFENTERILKKGLKLKIDKSCWKPQNIFKLIQDHGKVSESEMYRTFNMGIGMTIVVPKSQAKRAIRVLKNCGEIVYVIGEVVRK